MPVVKVIDDAHVRRRSRSITRDLVLRLTEPAAVVVEPDLAIDLPGLLGNIANGPGHRIHAAGLGNRLCPANAKPDLGLHLPSPKRSRIVRRSLSFSGARFPYSQNPAGGCGVSGRVQFAIKRGDVFAAPVIGQPRDAQPIEHLGPLSGSAFHPVERHDDHATRLPRANRPSEVSFAGLSPAAAMPAIRARTITDKDR